MDGPFVGRGPRGYHRSDERIREDVCELLTRHGAIDASQMEVEVRNGEVILRGTADSGRIRRLTEEIVEEISGVHDVRNELRVNQRTGYTETSRAGAVDTSGPAYGTGVANTSGSVPTGGRTQHAEAGGAQIGSRFTVRETMEVVGSDGVGIGQVKEVRGTDFLVERPTQREVYVPFSAIRTVDGDRVMIDCPARDVDRQSWPTPDLTGASQQRPSGGG